MIICHCNLKTDRDIRRAVHEGGQRPALLVASGAAGSGCAGCLSAVVAIWKQEQRQARARDRIRAPRASA